MEDTKAIGSMENTTDMVWKHGPGEVVTEDNTDKVSDMGLAFIDSTPVMSTPENGQTVKAMDVEFTLAKMVADT